MNSRQIAIVIGATLGAFVLAFGVGKAAGGGGDSSSAKVGGKAQALKVAAPSVGAFAGAGSLSALKAEKKKAAKKKSTKKKTTTAATTTTTAAAPPTSTSTQQSAPQKNNTLQASKPASKPSKPTSTSLGSTDGTD